MPAITLKLFSPETPAAMLRHRLSLHGYWCRATTPAQRRFLALLMVFLLGLVLSGV